jgi:PIN domain nuclease of toxin-antitoxin system
MKLLLDTHIVLWAAGQKWKIKEFSLFGSVLREGRIQRNS